MTADGWIQLGIFIVCLAGQGVLQYVAMNRKLTQVCEQLKNVRERCKERASDHKHHFVGLEEHGKLLANHEVRITQLERVPGN